MLLMALATGLIIATAGGVGVVFTLLSEVVNRWGRYELHWDFDDPFPVPKRFWTRGGAQRYLAELKTGTQEHMNIRDRRTGTIL